MSFSASNIIVTVVVLRVCVCVCVSVRSFLPPRASPKYRYVRVHCDTENSLGHHSLIPCFPSTARILANLPRGMLLLVITIMNIIKI